MRYSWFKLWLFSFPGRIRHAWKHAQWMAEDKDGNLWCTLCMKPLTGWDSWHESKTMAGIPQDASK